MFEIPALVAGALIAAGAQPKTDFSTWKRDVLEDFARAAADENLILKEDLKAALAAWRKELAKQSPHA